MATTADQAMEPKPAIGSAADAVMDSEDQAQSIRAFAGQNGDYYAEALQRIQNARSRAPQTFNNAAALLGPLWAGARGLWSSFWVFLLIETVALVQLCRGLFGDLGADATARATRLAERAQEMADKAAAARAGGGEDATSERLAANLQKAAANAEAAAEAASAGATMLVLWGLGLLLIAKIVQGLYANVAYEHQYTAWRTDKTVPSGFAMERLLFAIVMALLIVPLTVYRFTASQPWSAITSFPVDKQYYNSFSLWLDERFDAVASAGQGVFDGITGGIRMMLDGLEAVLVGTPWPVVMIVILVAAWRVAGPRVAIFTAAALAYLAFLGFWEKSMTTVALLGAAALLCVVIGIPLGIWFAKSARAYAIARPVLDFMQTMPAFVYLIPVIAFFGTGKPPGILATIIFGMPPVIRLTALGVMHVPATIKEAAVAFGATRWQLLKDVEIPLAMPSIMTGVNQTILMCLSMVVIASLIGAEGLGQDVLVALQYAAKGQGLLAGLAILFCAMVIDRIVQGQFRRQDEG